MESESSQSSRKVTEEGMEYVILRQHHRVTLGNVLFQVLKLWDYEIWRVIIVTSLLLHYICASYQYIFSARFEEGESVKRHIQIGSYVAVLLCDVLYALDYFLALTIFAWKRVQMLLVRPPRSRRLVIIDTFLVPPYALIVNWFTGGDVNTLVLLSLKAPVIVRLYHVFLYFREKSHSAGVNHWVYFIAQYLINTMLLHHSIACLWFLMALPPNSGRLQGWGAQFKNVQWSLGEWYLQCLYFAMILTTTCGFGDIYPVTTAEKILAVFAMSFGFILTTGVFIGALSSQFVASFQRRSTIGHHLEAVLHHLKSISMDKKTIRRIKTYYDILWRKKSGVYFAEDLMLLPAPLRTEICFDVNIRPLYRFLIFRDKPESVLRSIGYCMKHEFYQPGDMIFERDVVKDKMVDFEEILPIAETLMTRVPENFYMIYIVVGKLEALSEEDDQSPIITFGRRSCFAGYALILSLPARVSLRAATYTELQVLYKVDFLKIIELYPDIFIDIRANIFDRIKEAKAHASTKSGNSTNVGHEVWRFETQYQEQTVMGQIKEKLKGKIPKNGPCDKYFSLYNLHNKRKSSSDKIICFNNYCPWILHPNSSLAWCWEALIILLSIFIGLTYPYYIAFMRHFPDWLRIGSYFVEFILLVDVYMICTTAIIEKNRTVKTVLKILVRRLRQYGFYMDIMSSLYIEVFAYAFGGSDRTYYVFKLNRLLKVYRVLYFFQTLENHIEGPAYLIRLAKYPVFLLFIPYWFGALLYLASCYNEVCNSESWFYVKMESEVKELRSNPLTEYPAVISTYFALTCMTAMGFGDVLPKTTWDYALVYTAVIIGILMFGYCTSELSATIAHRFKVKTEFQANLFSVIRFMEGKKLSNSIKNRVINFLVFHWYHDRGVSLEGNGLFYNTNSKIQLEVLMLEREKTFRTVPSIRISTDDYVKCLVSASRSLIIPPNEVVVYEGGTSRDLFIIQEGYCFSISEGKIEVLGPNDCFGVFNSLFNFNSPATIVTKTHTRILFVDEGARFTTISRFPMVLKMYQFLRKELKVPASLQERQFKGISLDKNEGLKTKMKWSEGSFINVYKYCKNREEWYWEPFSRLEYLSWTKFLLVPICILPSGRFIKVWVGLRLLTAIITGLIIPYQQVISPYTAKIDPVTLLLDLVAWVDLYVMMLVGYYGPKNQLIIHPYKTAGHYIKGRFLLDVILCFPIELLIILCSPAHDEDHSDYSHALSPHFFHCVARLPRVGQLYRLLQLFDYLQKDIKRKAHIFQIIKYVSITIFGINIWASIQVWTSCYYKSRFDLSDEEIIRRLDGTYAAPAGLREHPLQDYGMFCTKNCWIDLSLHFAKLTSPLDVYIVAVYVAIGSLTGCGFGDVTSEDVKQLYMTMIIMNLGIMYFGYVYANIAGNKAALDNLVTKNQEMLKDLKRFLISERYGRTEQLIALFEYKWKRSTGTEPNVMLAKMHSALHEDAVLSMYEAILREVPLFEGVDPRFFREIGKQLREKYYLRHNVILRADDVVDSIFIIYRGKVDVYSSVNNMQAFVGICGIFGNITPYPRTKISVTITALTNVDTLLMETKTFYKILKKFPSIEKKLLSTLEKVPDLIIPTSFVEEEEDEDDLETDLSEHSSKLTSSLVSSHSGSRATFSTTHSLANQGTVHSCMFALRLLVCPHTWFRVAILPTSPIYSTLNFVCMVVAYLNSIQVTYQFAFHDESYVHVGVAIVFDFLTIVKIFFDMHKAYENRYGDYILSNRRILKRYFSMKKRRIFDLVVNIPFCYLALVFLFLSDVDAILIFTILRLITVLRLIYILDYFNEQYRRLMVNLLVIKICFLVLWLTLILHFLSCIWYLFACPLTGCLEHSWATAYSIVLKGEKQGKFGLYITCLYFIVSVFTTTGTGDVLPVNIREVIYVIIVMVASKFLIGTFIVEVMSVVTTYAASLENYENGIAELWDYLRNENVSSYQMDKMWMYVKQLWNRNNGKQMPVLLSVLTYTNRCELMTDIYGHHLRNSYLFVGLEESFIRQVSNFFQRTVFFTGNYIVQHGDSDKSMYFVHKGEIEILTVHSNLTETVHQVLIEGDMFGLAQGLYQAVPHYFSFRARSAVDIIYLNLSSWEHLLDFFPKCKEIIYQRAREIYNTN